MADLIVDVLGSAPDRRQDGGDRLHGGPGTCGEDDQCAVLGRPFGAEHRRVNQLPADFRLARPGA